MDSKSDNNKIKPIELYTIAILLIVINILTGRFLCMLYYSFTHPGPMMH